MKIKIERKSALELILGEKKKMLQGLSAEYTHKQTYVNTAHRAPLPRSFFCRMTHTQKKQSPQATKHTRNSADRDTHIHAQTHTLTI